MQNYKTAFFDFLKEMRIPGRISDAQGEKLALEKHLGKDLNVIEQEFLAFIKDLVEHNINEKIYQDYRMRLVQTG